MRLVAVGQTATRTRAKSSHNRKPARYVQSVQASGGHRTDRKAARPGRIGSVDLAGLGLAAPDSDGSSAKSQRKPERNVQSAWASGGQRE